MTAPPGANHGHIIFVGLPGAGKTTVGRIVADRLGASFLDFDVDLERRTQKSIAELFRERGEAYFRSLERDLTREVMALPASVLSPGGGWMANSQNVALVRPPSRIIHLIVGVDTALKRLGTQVPSRPLLIEGARDRLQALWNDRRSAYATADAAIDTEVLTLQSVVDSALELAEDWGWSIG